MYKTSQTQTIKDEINKLLENGETDQNKIYTLIVENLNVPRPTVRRTARDLKLEMMKKIDILSGILTEKEE